MAFITERDLKSQIKNGELSNVYFLFGDEKFLVKHYTEKIKSLIVKDSKSTFNFFSFSGDDLDADSFASAVNMVPFLSEKKCVRLIDFDITKLGESVIKKVKTIIESVPNTTVLIISQTGIDINVKKNQKWINFIKFMDKYGHVCEFKHMTKIDVSKLLSVWAKKSNVIIKGDISNLIIDICGMDLTTLKNEFEKLICFVGPGNEITVDVVNNLLVKDLNSNVFILGKYIVNRNADMAFKELDTLLYEKEEPIVILSILSSTYIDMYRVKSAIESGNTTTAVEKIFDEYKGKSFRLDYAIKNCNKFSTKSLKRCIELLTMADLKLKTSRTSKRTILDILINDLINIS